jgi:hypothetical protein
MTQFFDAFSGKKRELVLKRTTPKITLYPPFCEGRTFGHEWDNEDDDHCKCKDCGATVVFVQALRNLKKPVKEAP